MAARIFHKSPVYFRKSIKSNGLLPKIGNQRLVEDKHHHDAVFFYIKFKEDDPEFDSTYDDDIWEIMKLPINIQKDLNYPENHNFYLTTDRIDSKDLKLIHKGADTAENKLLWTSK